MRLSGIRFALGVTLLGISGIAVGAPMICKGAVNISRSEDYLVNLLAVVESDCLQDTSQNEELLSTVFATRDARVTYRDSEKVNYSVISRDGADRRSVVFRITLHTAVSGVKKVTIDAYFSKDAAITHDSFTKVWAVTRRPFLRNPHLPSNLDSYRYTLLGGRPGLVTITTNEHDFLTYLGYEGN